MQSITFPYAFSQLHIDAARNSTDDFNLFHDSKKWSRIKKNPFAGPIVLGFQLECLIEHEIHCHRTQYNELVTIATENLRFSNYQFTFANAVKANEPIKIDIKKSRLADDSNRTFSNRVVIQSPNGVSLLGYKKESRHPLYLAKIDLGNLSDLSMHSDRSFLDDGLYFLKRKYLTTSNAKNFLIGSNVDQTYYFDELENKFFFPETFPTSLISCALLERGLKENHDFEAMPMIYTSHYISIDTFYMRSLKSNDVLHILVKKPEICQKVNSANNVELSNHVYQCFGVLEQGNILYRASISLMPLADILKSYSFRNR